MIPADHVSELALWRSEPGMWKLEHDGLSLVCTQPSGKFMVFSRGCSLSFGPAVHFLKDAPGDLVSRIERFSVGKISAQTAGVSGSRIDPSSESELLAIVRDLSIAEDIDTIVRLKRRSRKLLGLGPINPDRPETEREPSWGELSDQRRKRRETEE